MRRERGQIEVLTRSAFDGGFRLEFHRGIFPEPDASTAICQLCQTHSLYILLADTSTRRLEIRAGPFLSQCSTAPTYIEFDALQRQRARNSVLRSANVQGIQCYAAPSYRELNALRRQRTGTTVLCNARVQGNRCSATPAHRNIDALQRPHIGNSMPCSTKL